MKIYIKYLTIKITYDSEETWDKTHDEIKEIMDMMKTISRQAEIVEIKQGGNTK